MISLVKQYLADLFRVKHGRSVRLQSWSSYAGESPRVTS